MGTVRTLERGYVKSQRAGQVKRLHIIREDGPRGWEPGSQTLCHVSTGRHQQSEPIIREAPHPLPPGLAWCPECVGRLAEQLGKLDEVAFMLGLTLL